MLNEKHTKAMQDQEALKAFDESITRHSSARAHSAVELNIEELVLHGFAANDHYRIGEFIESELARLVSEQGVPPSFRQAREISSLAGLSFDIAADAHSETIGSQIALAIHGGFSQC